VAVNLAAHGDYILLKALTNEGIPVDSVNRVAIQPPDAAAAFATGKIDAWSTFGVFFSTAVRNGARVSGHMRPTLARTTSTSTPPASRCWRRIQPPSKLFIKVVNDLVDRCAQVSRAIPKCLHRQGADGGVGR
jgi:hypothetical protein